MGWIHKIKKCKKSRDTATLNGVCHEMFDLFFLDLKTSHHTPESDSMVCILPWSQAPSYRGVVVVSSQTAHHEVRIEHFAGLWLLVKGQSREIKSF